MVWIDRQTRTTPVANGEGASQPAANRATPPLSPSIPRHLPSLSSSCPPEFPGRGKKKSDDVPYLVEQYPFKIATTNDDEWMGMARWLLCPGTYRCRAVDGKQLAFLELPSWCVCPTQTGDT